MSAKEDTRTDTAPKRLGRYRLLRKIARGGMAEVFVGRSYGAHGFEKTVAIKRILSRYSEDPQFVRMMVDEAKISVLLTHPNIAQVLEFGEEQGRYFLVMEYVPGQSLSALVKKLRAAEERLDSLEACFLIVEALQGLHAAHIQTDAWGKPAGIIHRDVSPQNILLSYDGHVKVIDFGIARARDRLEKTQIGTIKGKLRYLAPEMIDPQRFSKKGDFDHRVDVFAAGIILYELVAGRTLFTGADELEVYDHITRGDIPDLSLEKLCDPPLMRIIRRALERDPDKRYPSGEAFADELRAYLYRRDPAFNNKRIAAVLERHFGEEKAQRQALEEPDPALSDEQLEVHLTRTSHTPSRSRSIERPALQKPAQSEVWAASDASSASAPQSGTSVSRRAPRNRRSGEIPAALGDHLQAAPDAETRVGDPMELELGGEISQTQADPTAHLEVDGDSSQETSTSVVPARAEAAASAMARPLVREPRREPHEDTPATNRKLPRATRPSRGPAVAIAGAVVVGLLLAIVVVVALEARDGPVEVVSVNAGEAVSVTETQQIPADAVPLLVAATPQSARIELLGQPGTSSAPAVFMVSPGAEVEVRVSAPGYESRRERVLIEEGQPQLRISVELAPLPVTLTVEVEPAGAEVTVDEEPYRPGMDIRPGLPIVVRAQAEGHEARVQTVTPKPGEPLTLSLILPPAAPLSTPPPPRAQQSARAKPKPAARGSLTITSTPYWGRVTIDGKTLEETTPLTVKLKAGTHSVEVSHPPKGIVERFTIKVEPGDKLRRTVKFK